MNYAHIDQSEIEQQVAAALEEDVGSGDITAQLISGGTTIKATIISREGAVFCGKAWGDAVFRQLDPAISVNWLVHDGEQVLPNQELCHLSGEAAALLTGERTALNFLQTLSGTATQAHRFASAVAGTNCRILDTRKTLPGLRKAQKYAVKCGGAENHRIGLYDAILIKENHIMAAGSITTAVDQARKIAPSLTIEVEVETLSEAKEAIEAGADILLLDNMNTTQLKEAVVLNANRAKLEASGNVSLDNIRDIAQTGVDYVSVGSITKHLRAIDLSMRFQTN